MMSFFSYEKFNKKPFLEKNDGLTVYENYASQQNTKAYEVFYKFIQEVKPERILEIGTGLGGFIMYLKLCCEDLGLNTVIRTYDIHSRIEYEDLRSKGINVYVENVFDPTYSEVSKDIIDFIQQEGVTLVLCDGGWKIGEFNLLSKYLKEGDFIMAHDYAPDEKYFVDFIKGKTWNWFEIEDSVIENAVSENDLKPFMVDDFLESSWVCKYK